MPTRVCLGMSTGNKDKYKCAYSDFLAQIMGEEKTRSVTVAICYCGADNGSSGAP